MFEGIDKKRGLTATATLFTAALAGYVMQNGILPSSGAQPVPAAHAQVAMASVYDFVAPALPAPPVAAAAPIIETVSRAETRPVLAVAMSPMQPAQPEPVSVVSLTATDEAEAELQTIPPVAAPVAGAAEPDCAIGFTATASPGALVDLTFEAPCHSGQRVEIAHAGLTITEFTDENGLLQVSVPALQEDARFTATLADGHVERTDILMFTVSDYDRYALMWQGETGFQLHVLEAGADFGEAGHLRADAPGSADRASRGEGGFLAFLGAAPDGNSAVVYSYPSYLSDSQAAPELSVEAEITPANCGQSVSGAFLRVRPNAAPAVASLGMAIPGCDAIGEFLVLIIPPQDRRIARN